MVQTLNAQHNLTGTFSPAKNYKWVLVYHQKPNGQLNFVAEGGISNGKTEISLPKEAPKGTYRVVYGLPEDKNYFEILYSGEENISFSFSPQGLTFIQSEENKIISGYFSEIYTLENKLINFYRSRSTDVSQLDAIIRSLKEVQATYEKKSDGLMAKHFIKANHPYIPTTNENAVTYIINSKDHYFDHLDSNNKVLQGSNFLNDKLFNYVFTSLPPKRLSAVEVEKVMQENVTVLMKHLSNGDESFKLYFLYALWKKASDNKMNSLADIIYNEHLKSVAVSQDKTSLIKVIDKYNTLRVGATAPDIVGEENSKNLSDLSESDYYLLVFWNSQCPHCLEQLPILHEKLTTLSQLKVLAIGLESDLESWKKESAQFNGFSHSVSMGELISKVSITYEIKQTPTYYILDAEKKILAKPLTTEEVFEFFKIK
ncbi:MAG: thioredoxin family protein [Flavobacteriaceae bacterium]